MNWIGAGMQSFLSVDELWSNQYPYIICIAFACAAIIKVDDNELHCFELETCFFSFVFFFLCFGCSIKRWSATVATIAVAAIQNMKCTSMRTMHNVMHKTNKYKKKKKQIKYGKRCEEKENNGNGNGRVKSESESRTNLGFCMFNNNSEHYRVSRWLPQSDTWTALRLHAVGMMDNKI